MGELQDLVDRTWSTDIVPTLQRYIEIPNVSPAYAADWAEQPHMEQAVEMFRSWAEARDIEGMTVDVHRLDGLTPVIVIEIPATTPNPSERWGFASLIALLSVPLTPARRINWSGSPS